MPKPWAVGMQRLAPGVYADGGGAIHVFAVEMCEHFGVPCTDENYSTLRRAVADAMRDAYPEAAVRIEEAD
jgi:hypothetical protein